MSVFDYRLFTIVLAISKAFPGSEPILLVDDHAIIRLAHYNNALRETATWFSHDESRRFVYHAAL